MQVLRQQAKRHGFKRMTRLRLVNGSSQHWRASGVRNSLVRPFVTTVKK